MGRNPSPIDPERMKQLWDEGMTFEQIGEVFGCSFSAVRRRWVKEGFPPPPRGKRVGMHRTPIDLERSDELLASGMTMAEAAEELGVSESTLYNRRKESGRPPLKKGSRRPERNYFWRGGRTIDKHGYVLIKANDHPHANCSGYVREHRLVMEQAIGRYLRPEEVVHHINGVNDDNRIENLELFASNADHLRATLKGKCPNWSDEGIKALRRGRSKVA